MVSQKDFEKTISNFEVLEKRGSFYPLFLKMMEDGYDIEAYLLILSTWNFASFRYALRDFDLNNFKEVIRSLKVYFDKFKNRKLQTINLFHFKKEIIKIFEPLYEIKGVRSTGAPKLMHLVNPEVFIMWDSYIRKYYDFKKGKAEDYFNFLIMMQSEFKGVKFDDRKTTFAKAIDEYNYLKISVPQLEKIRASKKREH